MQNFCDLHTSNKDELKIRGGGGDSWRESELNQSIPPLKPFQTTPKCARWLGDDPLLQKAASWHGSAARGKELQKIDSSFWHK